MAQVAINKSIFQTSSLKQMSHHCGLVIENVLQKDEGTWQCNLDLLDGKSNFHTFKKVIDLKVNKRRRPRKQRKRQRDQFSLYGSYEDEYGSGDGSGDGGDEVSRGETKVLKKAKSY